MKGSLQIKGGKYYAVISYKDELGKFKTKWVCTGLTERGNKKAAKDIMEAEIEKFSAELEAKKALKMQLNESINVSMENPSFTNFLKQNLEKRKDGLSPTVVHNYINCYLPQIEKYFGNKLLVNELTIEKAQEFYAHLIAKGLKGSSVKHFTCVLHPAYKEAYKDGYLKMNIVDFLKVPKKEKYRGDYYDKNDIEKFFARLIGHDLELVYKVAAYYGFRRSELLGLRWDAVDFERKTIQIRHKLIVVGKQKTFSDELKTKASCRTLPLMPSIETELKKQFQKREENMNFFGDIYNHMYQDYIFTYPNGDMILPNFVTHFMDKIIKKYGLKKIRFHDLRHSCASLMLAEGVPMKQIQEWLGHASFKTTADIYSHLDYGTKLQSADKIAGALDKVTTKSKQPTEDKADEYKIQKLINELNIPIEVLKEYLANTPKQQPSK